MSHRARKISLFILMLSALVRVMPLSALEPEENAVFTKVIDTGSGLATITRMPDGFTMIYDTGHWRAKAKIMKEIAGLIPKTGTIDLMVLSHGDTDHISAAPLILNRYRVRTVLRCGLERRTKTWLKLEQTLGTAARTRGTRVITLRDNPLPFGATLLYRRTLVTFVSGFYAPPDLWDLPDKTGPRFRNAGSIVIRLTYKGKSILFTGDAIGRQTGGEQSQLMATEGFMVDNADAIKIDSDVLIAPHHGADCAGSARFIRAVSPEFVIFSSGHGNSWPSAAAARRYLDQGVPLENIFRTDLNDDEGPDEWSRGRKPGFHDPVGDDDVDILIRGNGEIRVGYSN